jgi:hypothetical protein
MSLATDLKAVKTVWGVKLDAQEPLLKEMNEQYVECNVPKEFYIPFGKLRIGKIIGRGAVGTIRVGWSM